VFRDTATGKRYVIGYEGEKVFGIRIYPDPDEADDSVIVIPKEQ
jgi:hypothetical protein